MKPFDNVIVSSAEPKNADIWVKHSKNLLRLQDATKTQDGITVTIKNNKIKLTGTATQGTTINLTDFTNLAELNSKIIGKTITLSSENIPTVELNFASSSSVYYMQITGLKKQTTKQISEEIIFIRFYIGGNVTLNAEFEIQVEFGDTATKYEEPVEDNIMVNDNGVYNSVLPIQDYTLNKERKIGKWITGEDLYSITVQGTSPEVKTDGTYGTTTYIDLSNRNIKQGMLRNSWIIDIGNNVIGLPYLTNSGNVIKSFFNTNLKKVEINCNVKNYSEVPIIAEVIYTKN